MDAEDHIASIAESYKGIHESNQLIARAITELRTTQQLTLEMHRLTLQLQRATRTWLGVTLGALLLFTGYVIWQHGAQSQEHALLIQALTATLQRLPKP